MLNSLYGKFGLNPHGTLKKPILSESGIVKYINQEEKLRKPINVAVASFITSYARKKTITTSQAIREYSLEKYGEDLYCYSDTDSIHTLLPIEECKNFCDIDDYRLGAWKHESSFEKALFVRQKVYLEIFDGELQVKCAGMPQSCIYRKKDKNGEIIKNKYYYKDEEDIEQEFTIDKFKVGFKCKGKLDFKHVKGGVILVDTEFTIKEIIVRKGIVNMF